MLGAIIGDIVGSRFEHHNLKSKDFEFLTSRCRPTDDSIMSLAVAQALLDTEDSPERLGEAAVSRMREYGRKYPRAGYGGAFRRWLESEMPQPYNSYGNGAAMRVSACGFAAESPEDAKRFARAVTEVTHNHPESIKAAEAIAVAIVLAKQGRSMREIRDYILYEYYPIDFTLNEIRESYRFDVSCQGSVPQAFEAFFELTGYEDAIRNAVSIGGDSDTIAAVTGGLAEAYYGIPGLLRLLAIPYLDETLQLTLLQFEQRFGA